MPRRTSAGPLAKALGEHIRLLRERRRMTLSHLAEAAGISKSNLSAIENGRVMMTIETQLRLIHGLGITIAGLWEFPHMHLVIEP